MKSQGLPLNLNPCIGIDGPVFPTDSATRCEVFYDFDPDYTITHNTSASELTYTLFPEGDTKYNGRDILIEGHFLVDVPVAFKNCRIKMNPGAQIVVSARVNPSELFARNSEFFSCDTMWKGITLGRGTKCRLYWTRIEDAQYALVVDTSVALTIFKGTFNRNFVGITNRTRNSALPFLTLTHNTFTCTSPLNEPYDLPAFTNYDPVSFAGILLNECSSSIGYFNANNVFNNLIYGILAANASVAIVKGCVFLNAQKTAAIPDLIEIDPIGSSGIAGVASSSIFVNGESTYESCSFNSANIWTDATTLEVSHADFTDSKILYKGFMLESAKIEDNNFEALNEASGITVTRSMATGLNFHTEVSRNRILSYASLQGVQSGIYINGILAPEDYAIVDNNYIEFSNESPHHGIYSTIYKSKNLLIENDTIRFDADGLQPASGIHARFQDGLPIGHIIRNNIISGINYSNSDPSYGIYSLSAGGILYCNNITDSLRAGMLFRYNCDLSQLSQNKFNEHSIGLLIEPFKGGQGFIGPQFRTRNEWLDESFYNPFAAAINNNTSDFNQFSSYYLSESDALNETYNPTDISPETGWFQVLDGDPTLCTLIDRPIISAFDSLILGSHSLFEDLPEPTRFYLEKNLISKILDDVDLKSNYSSYLNSINQTSEYLIAEVTTGMKEAFRMDSTDQANSDSILNKLKLIIVELQVFDSINYANIDTVSFTEGVGLDSIYAKLKACCELAKSQTIIKAIRRATLYADLGDLQVALDTISTRANYDEYYRTIYALFIKKMVEGSLTAAEDSLILEIALDVADSSLANILAFDLFRPCSDEAFPEYFENDTKQNVEIKRFQDDLVGPQAFDAINVQFKDNGLQVSSRSNINGLFQMFDITGRLLYSQKINDFEVIPIKMDLAQGLYIWNFTNFYNPDVFNSGILSYFR